MRRSSAPILGLLLALPAAAQQPLSAIDWLDDPVPVTSIAPIDEAPVATGVSLWLNADLNLLWSRVKHKDTRPLLRTDDPFATLRALYEARVPFYELVDLSVVSRPEYSIETMTGHVIEALLARPDVLEAQE